MSLLITDLSPAEALDKFVRGTKASTRLEIMKNSHQGLTLEQAISTCLYLGGLKGSNSSNYQQNKLSNSAGAPMDLDVLDAEGNHKPLTSKQKTYLATNNGCFYCRKPNVSHRAATCPQKKTRLDHQQVDQQEDSEEDEYSTD